MAYRIAITGKGGVGKTTVAALVVARLVARGCRPVLAVDADPNTCLDGALGVQVRETIGRIREEAREVSNNKVSSGVTKQQLLEMKIAESLVEAEDFDLIAMGRSEGPGCYCAANNILKAALTEIADNYPYLVLDNEAGLENLSRRLVTKVDALLIVADPSRRGIETLGRLWELSREMGLAYEKLVIVINRLRREEMPPGVEELRQRSGAANVLLLPENEQVAAYNETGRSTRELPEGNPVVEKIDALLAALLKHEEHEEHEERKKGTKVA